MVSPAPQSIREAFAFHRWRLRSADEIERDARRGIELLAADDARRELAVVRLRDVLRFAPYHLAIHDALAVHFAGVGNEDECLRHLSVRVDVTGALPDPKSPALASKRWSAAQRARLRAALKAERHERGSDLMFKQLAPRRGFSGVIRWADDHTPAVKLAYERFLAGAARAYRQVAKSEWGLEDVFLERFASPFRLDDEMVGAFYPFSAIHQLFADLAPHIEDVRLLCYTQVTGLDEIWIVDGNLYVVRHPMVGFVATSTRLHPLAEEVPDDEALRAYVREGWCAEAGSLLEQIAEDRSMRASLTKKYGVLAHQLHDVDPPGTTARYLAQVRGALEHARRLGGEVGALSAKLDALPESAVHGPSPESLFRYDALVKHAKELLAKEDYEEALRVIDLAVGLEPSWYEDSSLLRGCALEGMGRSRLATAAFRSHIARKIERAPYHLMCDALWLLVQHRLDSAELIYRSLFDAAFFVGVASRVGAAECRALAGDVAEARSLLESAIKEAEVAKARHKKTSIGAEIDNYQRIAKYKLTLLK